jgi:DICT domain-containing protein
MSIFLESRALASGDSAVVLSTFQHHRNLTPATRRRDRALAETAGLVAVYMAGDAEIERDSRIRVAQIGPTDPPLDEWDIVVLTADFAAVLAAREVNPSSRPEPRATPCHIAERFSLALVGTWHPGL